MKKMKVFVWNSDPDDCFGNGTHRKKACFPQGVHVEFTIQSRKQDEDLVSVSGVKKCDSSCISQAGHIHEFGSKPGSMDYDTRPIVRAVERYVARQAERRVKTAAKAKK